MAPRIMSPVVSHVSRQEQRHLLDPRKPCGYHADACLNVTNSPGGPCVACAPGKYENSNWTAAVALLQFCIDCAPGKYSGKGARWCTSCPNQSYSILASPNVSYCKCNQGYTASHAGACTACVAGKYKEARGQHNCSDCPANTFSPLGAVWRENCTCNAGNFPPAYYCVVFPLSICNFPPACCFLPVYM